jgi:hypothetical protein
MLESSGKIEAESTGNGEEGEWEKMEDREEGIRIEKRMVDRKEFKDEGGVGGRGEEEKDGEEDGGQEEEIKMKDSLIWGEG